VLNKKYKFRFRIELRYIREIFVQALPLYGYALLMVVYQQADVILLKYFTDSYSTGIFSGAMRLSFPLYIFPTALISTIFPSISRNIEINEDQNIHLMRLGIKVVILFAVFVALFVSFKSEEIVVLILGPSYSDSNTPLILLLWSQVFIFISFMINDYLTAYKMQKWNFIYAAVMVIIDLSITLILIRHLFYTAPSVSKIISGFTGMCFIIYITGKIKLNFGLNYIRIFSWIVVSAGVLFLLSYLPFPLYIVLSPVLFIAIVFGLKYFSGDEVNKLLSLFKINMNIKWLSSL
jgi:PST family polysaccharide transporter